MHYILPILCLLCLIVLIACNMLGIRIIKYNNMFQCVYRCIYELSNSDYSTAYNYQNMVVQGLIKLFQALKDDNWLLPVINTVCLELRLLAAKVDVASSGKGGMVRPREALEKAAEALMTCFRICAADK